MAILVNLNIIWFRICIYSLSIIVMCFWFCSSSMLIGFCPLRLLLSALSSGNWFMNFWRSPLMKKLQVLMVVIIIQWKLKTMVLIRNLQNLFQSSVRVHIQVVIIQLVSGRKFSRHSLNLSLTVWCIKETSSVLHEFLETGRVAAFSTECSDHAPELTVTLQKSECTISPIVVVTSPICYFVGF